MASEPTRLGKPAPFTDRQVAALTAGKADQAEVGKVLDAHRQPKVAASKASAKLRAPVALTEAQVRALGRGQGTPADVADALEKGTRRG